MNALPKLVKAKNCLLAVLVLSAALCAQSYQPYQNPKVQLFDNNGAPASGFSLCTFAAGTTTPQATYADNAGTVNPNPVVLDSAGRATVYLGAFSYKFILYAANGTGCPNSAAQIWTQDNIYDLAQISGAVLLNPGAAVSQLVSQGTATTFEVAVNGGASLTVGSSIAITGATTMAGLTATSQTFSGTTTDSSNGTFTGTNAYTFTPPFTNLAMSNPFTSLLNGYNIQTAFQAEWTSSNFGTSGIVAGITVPSGSTAFQAQALYGGIDNSSTTTNAVGVLAVSRALADGVHVWGMNPVVDLGTFDAGGTGVEADCNVNNTTILFCNPFSAQALFQQQPASGANAYTIGAPLGVGNYKWNAGFVTSPGATQIGLYLSSSCKTGTCISQPLEFVGLNSSSTKTITEEATSAGDFGFLTDSGSSYFFLNSGAGLQFPGASSGNTILKAASVAAGIVTIPAQTGGLPILNACGSTTTCADANVAGSGRISFGNCPFSASTTCTVTAMTAYTSTTSFFCAVTSGTNTGNTFKVANVSTSSITITAATSTSDAVGYICAGF